MAAKNKSARRVVIITDSRDAHVPFVAKHLDFPPIVIDPREIVAKKGLSTTFHDGDVVVSHDGQTLDSVSGVWFRKPQGISADDLPVPKEYRLYSKSSIQRLADSLYVAFGKSIWVSDYYALIRAESKAIQIALAQHLGLRVPETIMTSDPSEAAAFLKSHPRSVTESLAVAFPKVNGKSKLFFTTLLEDGFVPDLTNLHLAPAIFQEAVKAVADIRVTVVGNKTFAAIVKTERPYKKASKVYDFRFGSYENGMDIEEHAEFPAELSELSIALTKKLGLRFGAIDFVLDKKGQYWFLEINPNGQWAFVEQATNQPIGKELARLLQGDSL